MKRKYRLASSSPVLLVHDASQPVHHTQHCFNFVATEIQTGACTFRPFDLQTNQKLKNKKSRA